MWSSETEVTAMVCTDCGRTMSGLDDDIIHFCSGCRSVWSLESGRLVQFPFYTARTPSEQPGAPDLHLPFWLVRISTPGISILVRREHTSSPLEFPRNFDPSAERNLESITTEPEDRLVAVPAFLCERASRIGWRVTRHLTPVSDSDVPARALAGGVVTGGEAESLAGEIALIDMRRRNPGLAWAAALPDARLKGVMAVGFNLLAHGLQLAGIRLVLPYTTMADVRALIDFLDLTVPDG